MSDEKLRDEERSKCECWTRVMGYYRPIDDFNIGKRGEHAERVYFEEKLMCKDCNSDTK
ncbi:MAG: anaerobic ribonucleoside-triphosphate reductase [Holosporaceae bacterium]|nr:anaerobic ribonucleoside-triphosphate reductase [Holosporaceae bacterium]